MDIAKVGAALLRLDTDRIVRALKERWMDRTFPHGMDYRDEVGLFDRLYLIRDPWSLSCEDERFRFGETNRLIQENFGHPHSLLEIGCGEGLQSSELHQLCDCLYGIDISGRAIRRAKRRCPEVKFAVGDMYSLPQSVPATVFDLVTACEVLYYMPDIARALRRLSELGRGCIISYYDGARDVLDKYVEEMPGVKFATVSYQDASWTVAWWRP
jgi:2-polyprenyl-3-methyl-5-hydroxy-6-metoxy-1,4-benzoquinol methylase